MGLHDKLIKRLNTNKNEELSENSKTSNIKRIRFLFSIDYQINHSFYLALDQKISIHGERNYKKNGRYRTSAIIDGLIKAILPKVQSLNNDDLIYYFSFKARMKKKKKLLILKNYELLNEIVNKINEKTGCLFTKTEVLTVLMYNFSTNNLEPDLTL